MQIGASTLLAQQTARVAPKAQPSADGFAPLSFKQAAKAQVPMPEMQATVPAKPGTSASAGPKTGYVRPGTNIDIKV